MLVKLQDEQPLFQQIADGIEDAILSGVYPEETQIPSTTEISVRFNINPATALKGINLLVDNGIIYKKRGVGMFVAAGAAARLTEKRKTMFYQDYVEKLAEEARKLQIPKAEVLAMIERSLKK